MWTKKMFMDEDVSGLDPNSLWKIFQENIIIHLWKFRRLYPDPDLDLKGIDSKHWQCCTVLRKTQIRS